MLNNSFISKILSFILTFFCLCLRMKIQTRRKTTKNTKNIKIKRTNTWTSCRNISIGAIRLCLLVIYIFLSSYLWQRKILLVFQSIYFRDAVTAGTTASNFTIFMTLECFAETMYKESFIFNAICIRRPYIKRYWPSINNNNTGKRINDSSVLFSVVSSCHLFFILFRLSSSHHSLIFWLKFFFIL